MAFCGAGRALVVGYWQAGSTHAGEMATVMPDAITSFHAPFTSVPRALVAPSSGVAVAGAFFAGDADVITPTGALADAPFEASSISNDMRADSPRLTGLKPGATHRARARATGGGQAAAGKEIPFTTAASTDALQYGPRTPGVAKAGEPAPFVAGAWPAGCFDSVI